MIEFDPKGQEEVPIEQRAEDPLMAKDVRHVLSMIFMPTTPWDFLPCLSDEGIINDEKEDRLSLDSQGVEELSQSDLYHLLGGPNVLSQESGKAGKRSMQEGKAEGLNHGGGMNFFTKLDKSDDKG
jgi:hypothetical protein